MVIYLRNVAILVASIVCGILVGTAVDQFAWAAVHVIILVAVTVPLVAVFFRWWIALPIVVLFYGGLAMGAAATGSVAVAYINIMLTVAVIDVMVVGLAKLVGSLGLRHEN